MPRLRLLLNGTESLALATTDRNPLNGCGVESNMFEKIRKKLKRTPSLEARIEKIETLLEGDDQEPNHSNWTYQQIRTILDKSGLAPNMARNQELCDLDLRVDKIEDLLTRLGKTDAHTGDQTLEFRLSVIEGMLDIFSSAHKGHTNYSEVEYYGMHESVEQKTGQLQGLQKKLDRITKLLEKAEFTISGKEALKL